MEDQDVWKKISLCETGCTCVNNFQLIAKHIVVCTNNISDALYLLQMEKSHSLAEKLPHNCPGIYEETRC